MVSFQDLKAVIKFIVFFLVIISIDFIFGTRIKVSHFHTKHNQYSLKGPPLTLNTSFKLSPFGEKPVGIAYP